MTGTSQRAATGTASRHCGLGIDSSESVEAIHINMMGLGPLPGRGGARQPHRRRRPGLPQRKERPGRETAYQFIQGTKPQTLAYGLMDSPARLAAWIVEDAPGLQPGSPHRLCRGQALQRL